MNTIHLTPMEKAIVAVLEQADGPMTFRNIYAVATGTPAAYASTCTGHIFNLRRKGVRIGGHTRRGYWLLDRPEAAPQPLPKRRRVVVVPASPLFAALDVAYEQMTAPKRTWKADPPDTGVRRPCEGVA